MAVTLAARIAENATGYPRRHSLIARFAFSTLSFVAGVKSAVAACSTTLRP
jgi:hypothetical protein